ncbi:MAG: SIS domain-containing protein [Rhizomicrobium sp.]
MKRAPKYLDELHRLLKETAVTGAVGQDLDLDDSALKAGEMARTATAAGGTIFFIGNGGSAGIASHMAIDFTKNGGMRALAFNDGAYLTCLGNDLGFDKVFAKPLEMHARKGDLLLAISSSGRSANILNGVEAARAHGCGVLTFSGFDPANPLRRRGDINFYIESGEYGFVEIGHLALIHTILDLSMGWGKDVAGAQLQAAT